MKTMKNVKILMCLIVMMAINNSMAQIYDPVKWEVSSKKINDKEYQLMFTATIEAPWHLYSQYTPEGGPIPTSFKFIKNENLALVGSVKEEGDLHEKFEEVFMLDTRFYEDKVKFVQKITVKVGFKGTVSGTITYMVCNDTMCLPPTEEEFECKLQ